MRDVPGGLLNAPAFVLRFLRGRILHDLNRCANARKPLRLQEAAWLNSTAGSTHDGTSRFLPSRLSRDPSVLFLEQHARVFLQHERESVLFIGTRLSNLYTAVDTPAEAAFAFRFPGQRSKM